MGKNSVGSYIVACTNINNVITSPNSKRTSEKQQAG